MNQNDEQDSEEGFSLYEFYLNHKKNNKNDSEDQEIKPLEDFCFWNKLCSDEEDVFDEETGFATQPERRIGHSAVYLARSDEIYIFGGRDNEDLCDMWSFHIPTKVWTEFYAKNRAECWPSPIFDHTAVSISLSRKRFEKFLGRYPDLGQLSDLKEDNSMFVEKFYNQMYIFGGYNSEKHFSKELYCYDFTFNKFIKIDYEQEFEMIMERSRHSMVTVQDRYLYIIGGMTDKSQTLMDVWEYDIDRNVMKCLSKHSEQLSELLPLPRTFHSCVYSKLNHSIYMFGGIRNSEAFQDLWRFDLRTFQWFSIDNMKGFVPVERFKHSCFIPNEGSGYFFVYGGYNFRHSFLDYIYQFDFATLEWTRLQNRNYTQGGDFQSKGSLMFVDYEEIPSARSGMTSIITKHGDLVIFGGKSVTCLNDMFICRLPGYSKLRAGKHVKMHQNLLSEVAFVDIVCKFT